MRYALLVCVFVAGATASPTGHHSLTAIYDSATPIRFEAMVVEFQFIHPHPFVIVERNENERTRHWRLEMDNRFELTGIGMTATTLRQGDRVVVSGSPARDGSPGLYLRRLDRPADGFWYEQIGSSPRVGRR